eukprot:6491298-Amphidinium_carterae.2
MSSDGPPFEKSICTCLGRFLLQKNKASSKEAFAQVTAPQVVVASVAYTFRFTVALKEALMNG